MTPKGCSVCMCWFIEKMSVPETIEVTIFGKQYPILASSGKDAVYIRKLALFVDQKMKEIAEQVPDIPSMGVAVLACLNITDEFMTYRDSASKDLGVVDEMITSLVKDIDIRIAGAKNS